MTIKCQTCANQYNGGFCTMNKTMHEKSRKYKKCDGYKAYTPKPIVEEKTIVKVKEEVDYESLGKFGKFLRRGGGYSFRSKEFIGVE